MKSLALACNILAITFALMAWERKGFWRYIGPALIFTILGLVLRHV